MDKYWAIGPYEFEYHTDTGHLQGRLGMQSIGVRNVSELSAAKIASAAMVLEALNRIKFKVYEFVLDLKQNGELDL